MKALEVNIFSATKHTIYFPKSKTKKKSETYYSYYSKTKQKFFKEQSF